jgi:hypothetical protein
MNVLSLFAGLLTDVTGEIVAWLLGGPKTPAPEGRVPSLMPPSPGPARPPVRAAPAPALLPHELDDLNRLRCDRSILGRDAGQAIADGIRQRFPGHDDLTLGVIAADLYGYARAVELSLPGRCPDARFIVECFGLAAEDLTRLARTEEVPDGR